MRWNNGSSKKRTRYGTTRRLSGDRGAPSRRHPTPAPGSPEAGGLGTSFKPRGAPREPQGRFLPHFQLDRGLCMGDYEVE